MSSPPELPAPPTLLAPPLIHPSHLDYEHLLSPIAERLAVGVADTVANRLADLIGSTSGMGPQRQPRERKRRERCRLVQGIITRLLKQGLCVSKLEHIGSNRQPNALDIDDDDEAPWQIDWTVGPDHMSNRQRRAEVRRNWSQPVVTAGIA